MKTKFTTVSGALLTCLLLLLTVLPVTLLAQGGLSAGVKLGTTGFGIEGAFGLTENVNVRVGYSAYDFEMDYTTKDYDPNVKFNLDSDNDATNILIDYLPFKRGFRLTGGFIYQGPQFEGTGFPIESYTDPETGFTIPPDQMGSITINLEYEKKFSPYLGIGFGNSVGNQRLTFSFDAGVIFTGKATFTSEAVGRMADIIDYDEQQLRDDVEEVTVLPLISFGLSYRIF
ncbi:MAG TPA: hypothetical protein DCE78_03730 [Bacteroidetes bacterium]|nr:hypothetical protein [Bacteroidota bacterium]